MSRIIKLIDNEIIEIVEYSKANACFQTNKYPEDELFCVIRKQINPFDLFKDNEIKDKEISRLNNIINELEKCLLEKQESYRNYLSTRPKTDIEYNAKYATQCGLAQIDVILDKLKELKGENN